MQRQCLIMKKRYIFRDAPLSSLFELLSLNLQLRYTKEVYSIVYYSKIKLKRWGYFLPIFISFSQFPCPAMFPSFFGKQEVQEFWVCTNSQAAKVLESALKTLSFANIASFGPCPQKRRPSILIKKGIKSWEWKTATAHVFQRYRHPGVTWSIRGRAGKNEGQHINI